VYGYFPCYSEGNDLVVLDENGHAERARFTFPRQRQERRLCIADFFAPKSSSGLDVVGFQLVTVGAPISEYTAELFARDAYRDYLEVHGLSVQLTEALAEYWHRRVRSELVLPSGAAMVSQDPARWTVFCVPNIGAGRYAFVIRPARSWRIVRRSSICWSADRIGVKLTDEFQLVPEQATDAIIVHHPDANYFNAK